MIVSKNFSHLIDVKCPTLKLAMTPVWPWYDSIYKWPPTFRLHLVRPMNSMKLRLYLKWRRTPFPFLDSEMQLTSKLHVIELDKMKRFIPPLLYFVDYSLRYFLNNRELNEYMWERS